MGIKINDPALVTTAGQLDKTRPAAERQPGAAGFQEVLQDRIAEKGAEKSAVGSLGAPPAAFPVYEIDKLPDFPHGYDLREKGVNDTERLLAIMDAYHQNMQRSNSSPFDTRKLIEDMETVSRDMLGYMANLTSADDLYKLMRDSVVMARVEIEKYVRGDYG
ncbi:MAG: hypothetical protein JRJ56_02530 [Deltaproteobacteria bacterium]|nr:hypothetical protein [Deltaproteobacteria bacterium]